MYELITYSEYLPAQPTEVASTRDNHAPRPDSGEL